MGAVVGCTAFFVLLIVMTSVLEPFLSKDQCS